MIWYVMRETFGWYKAEIVVGSLFWVFLAKDDFGFCWVNIALISVWAVVEFGYLYFWKLGFSDLGGFGAGET